MRESGTTGTGDIIIADMTHDPDGVAYEKPRRGRPKKNINPDERNLASADGETVDVVRRPHVESVPLDPSSDGTILVRGRVPSNNYALWEDNEAHPGGVAAIMGTDEARVWPTVAVMRAVQYGRLERVPE